MLGRNDLCKDSENLKKLIQNNVDKIYMIEEMPSVKQLEKLYGPPFSIIASEIRNEINNKINEITSEQIPKMIETKVGEEVRKEVDRQTNIKVNSIAHTWMINMFILLLTITVNFILMVVSQPSFQSNIENIYNKQFNANFSHLILSNILDILIKASLVLLIIASLYLNIKLYKVVASINEKHKSEKR